ASAVPPAQAPAEASVMIRDARLDQLIAAHQQQGGSSALQMPAGFLRNATFERPAR
ncbi:MAG: anti-anti-sigma factor, partial [Curvibacter sp.]